MTGQITRSDDRSWKAAGWVSRFVARESIPLLPASSALDAGSAVRLGRDLDLDIDLRDYTSAEVAAFAAAVKAIEDKTTGDYPPGMDPEFHLGLRSRVAELRRLLEDRPPPDR